MSINPLVVLKDISPRTIQELLRSKGHKLRSGDADQLLADLALRPADWQLVIIDHRCVNESTFDTQRQMVDRHWIYACDADRDVLRRILREEPVNRTIWVVPTEFLDTLKKLNH